MSRLLRNALALLLGLLLGGAATWASATDGFAFNGVCHADSTKALEAYRVSFPYVSNGLVYELTVLEPLAVAGQYMYETTWYAGDIEGWKSISGISTFPVCTITDSMNVFPQNDVAFVIALVVLWSMGLSVGLKTA